MVMMSILTHKVDRCSVKLGASQSGQGIGVVKSVGDAEPSGLICDGLRILRWLRTPEYMANAEKGRGSPALR